MDRSRWIVFRLLNASWIIPSVTFSLFVWAFFNVFFPGRQDGSNPVFVGVLIFSLLAPLIISLVVAARFITPPLKARRPDLIQFGLPPLWLYWLVFYSAWPLVARMRVPDILVLPVIFLAFTAIGTGLSWLLSRFPSSPPTAS